MSVGQVRPGCLFICYSGEHPQYLEALYAAQLAALVAAGMNVHVLSFESPRLEPPRRERIARALGAAGVGWTVATYRRGPGLAAKLLDVVVGAARTLWLLWRGGYTVVHARSHVAGAMALLPARLRRSRFVFDLDGALPDEYVDAGRWRPGGLRYRLTKAVERVLLDAADVVLVRTRPHAEELRRSGGTPPDRVQVVRHGLDLARFARGASAAEEVRARLGLGGRTIYAYAGTADPRVHRLADMGRLVAAARRRDPVAHFLFLGFADAEATARASLAAGGLRSDALTFLCDVPAAEVPAYLTGSWAGIAFRNLPRTGHVVSPVKVAEYLASGIPVVCHEGIGDVAEILRSTRTGVVLAAFANADLEAALDELSRLHEDPSLAERCRDAAREFFGMEQALRALLLAYGVPPTGAAVAEVGALPRQNARSS